MPIPLTLFISSTCYDLSQIRRDLKSIYDSVGIRVLISDEVDFPVLPGEDRFETCFKNIIESDIFILIIGKRSGFITDNGKSVTNNELMVAVEKNIPIYCFIDKSIIPLFDVYKENKDIKIPGIDNNKLLDFAIGVYTNSRIWSYAYESFSDIHKVLSKQLPIVLGEGLRIRKKALFANSEIEQLGVSSKATKIIIQKPSHWEHVLFSQLLDDQIDKYMEIRLDREIGFGLDSQEYKFGLDAVNWIRGQSGVIQSIIAPINVLFSEEMQVAAFGPPGKPGDYKRIIYLANSLGKVYKRSIDWSISVRSVVTHEELEKSKILLSKFADGIIFSFEKFVVSLSAGLQAALNDISSGKNDEINLCWKLTMEEGLAEEFNQEYHNAIMKIMKNGG